MLHQLPEVFRLRLFTLPLTWRADAKGLAFRLRPWPSLSPYVDEARRHTAIFISLSLFTDMMLI